MSAPRAIDPEEADDRLGVLDFAAEDHGDGFVPGDEQVLDFFALFERRLAGGQAGGDVEMHFLVEYAGREEERVEELDFPGPIAGFFDQLALGGDVRRLRGLERAGGKLDQGLPGSDPPVADEADAAVIEQRDNYAGARVADDLAGFRFAAVAGNCFADDAKFGGGEEEFGHGTKGSGFRVQGSGFRVQ